MVRNISHNYLLHFLACKNKTNKWQIKLLNMERELFNLFFCQLQVFMNQCTNEIHNATQNHSATQKQAIFKKIIWRFWTNTSLHVKERYWIHLNTHWEYLHYFQRKWHLQFRQFLIQTPNPLVFVKNKPQQTYKKGYDPKQTNQATKHSGVKC